MSETYPKDEFDDLPDDTPVGVHRKPRSPWQPVIPFLIVLLVVPLLAWGIASLINRGPSDVAIVETEQSVEQSPAAEAEDGEGGETILPESNLPTAAPDDPNAKPSLSGSGVGDTTDVNFDVTVSVLNATGITGYAGTIRDELVAAGFVNAYADNAGQTSTATSTVFYSGPALQATAQAVATATGIGNVVEDPAATGNSDIVVLLME